MRFTLRLAGREVIHAELDTEPATVIERPRMESSGGGQFELTGFGFDVADHLHRVVDPRGLLRP